MKFLSALAGVLFLALGSAQTASPAERRGVAKEVNFPELFLHPPAESRIIKIIHSWPDEPASQDALIASLSKQGFGGVVCNVSFTDYLESETKWKAFARAVAAGKQAGFSLWLYDEKGYPSATAGGLVLRGHPEWEARGLLIVDTEIGGKTAGLRDTEEDTEQEQEHDQEQEQEHDQEQETELEGKLGSLRVPPGEPILMAAFPVRDGIISLAQGTNLMGQARDGQLSWPGAPGRWRVMAITQDRLYEGTHAAMSLADHIPYPNLLQPEPTARFLELTHRRYAERLGENLGRHFVSTFTDEPSLMSLFLHPMPYRVLPWAPNLPVEFRKRRGYALEPLIPALVAEAGPAGTRARYDYWKTAGELVAENYFGQIQRWCSKHHVLSGGHLLMEENLVNHVPLYGNFFQCLRRLDAPSIDCLTSIPDQVPWFIARLARSAAELESKSVVMCETSDHSQRYRPAGDQRPPRTVTEEEIRGTCNRLMVSGIDSITSYYSFADLSDEQLRRLNEWIGRCCTSLAGGHQVADVAVLYPVESLWTQFTPAHHLASDSPAATRSEHLFLDVSNGLFTSGRDFTYIDSRALVEAKVEAGALVHGDLRWRAVILPGADTLPWKAWQNLERFVRSGGLVIAIGTLPANSETEFPSSRVQALGNSLFGKGADQPRSQANASGGAGIFVPEGSAGLLPTILDSVLEPDLSFDSRHSPLRSTHRRIENREVYFVVNDSAKPWSGTIRLGAEGVGERWDPATGLSTPLPKGEQIPLSLQAYGAVFFRFPEARLPKRIKATTGILPGVTLCELPSVTPQIARGEHVRERMAPLPLSDTQKASRWRVTGALTKGQVDTFLFTRFLYSGAVDLQSADCLVLDTRIPEGQSASAQLLVILHEKGGADYLAYTGRLLNTPGEAQTFIPLNRFQLAGWSADANAQLNLGDISEIRIGWGGYYGVEGEEVTFELASPRTGVSATERAVPDRGAGR